MKIIFLLLLLLQTSCGYQAIQTANLFGHSVIYLQTFIEESPLGLSANLASAMHQQFLQGGIVLSHEHASQHPRLSGEIEQITNKPSSLAGGSETIVPLDFQTNVDFTITPLVTQKKT